jgi:aryl-alcohol dehydrogenase-like predicted oxidoreductase
LDPGVCQYGGLMKYVDVDGVGKVSRIGLGTWQFGSTEWGYGDSYASGAARDIVQRALALGVTLFDTAEVYALGKSERILGEALGDKRSAVALASKIFPIAPFPPVINSASAPVRGDCKWTAFRSTRSTSPTPSCRIR